MAISVTCSKCQKIGTIPEEKLGKKMRCPSCKHVFVVELVSKSEASGELPEFRTVGESDSSFKKVGVWTLAALVTAALAVIGGIFNYHYQQKVQKERDRSAMFEGIALDESALNRIYDEFRVEELHQDELSDKLTDMYANAGPKMGPFQMAGNPALPIPTITLRSLPHRPMEFSPPREVVELR